MPVVIDVGKNRLNGYAYYDQKREQQERNTFYKRLYDLMEVLKSKNLKTWMNPGEVFRETAKRDAKFIEWKAAGGKFQVSLRKNAVSQAINKMGKFIPLYRGEFTWEECLALYRSKDVVEKGSFPLFLLQFQNLFGNFRSFLLKIISAPLPRKRIC